jgi:restriction endonuclease S subunit
MEKHEASPNAPEPWVGADHLDEGDLRIRRWSMSDDPLFPPTFKFKFPAGAVLIHSRNPKKVAVAHFSAITGEKIFALASRDESTLLTPFLAYVLQSLRFEDFTHVWMTGSVNKFLNWSALERFEFALPPIDVQCRIVELLGSLDENSSQSELALGNSKVLQSAIFDHLVVDSEFEEEKLCDIADLYRGYSFSGSDYVESDGLNFLTLASVDRGGGYKPGALKLISAEVKQKHTVAGGELLVANTDLTPARQFIGRPFLVPFDLGQCAFSHHLTRIIPNDLSMSEWLYWELQSPRARRTITSSSRGSTVIMLDSKKFSELVVRVPDSNTRNTILKFMGKFETLNRELARKCEATIQLRKSILNAVLNGASRV